ncbi:MAG: DUF2062 domain-containing protein [Puniceicoccales bacterium]|jgi:uncharacterized protein (DUF2062 family)|nr:DUF2062 domain-containing protein [Puniceicoccales bacterium]
MCGKIPAKEDDSDSRFRRIRFVKKLLRHVPRKASIHKYPILNKFADVARKRTYLWSFKVEEVVPAFYLGWIITFMPFPSIIQIIIAFFFAIMCRANAMVLTFLQLISNPVTFVPLWGINYKIGLFTIALFGVESSQTISIGEIISLLQHSNFLQCSKYAMRCFMTIMLGAIILGPIAGAISSELYKYFARKYSKK